MREEPSWPNDLLKTPLLNAINTGHDVSVPESGRANFKSQQSRFLELPGWII
jgi:hypothetical protein